MFEAVAGVHAPRAAYFNYWTCIGPKFWDSAIGVSNFLLQLQGILVGARGFEPRTPCAQGRCATRLRYAPTPVVIRSDYS